MAFKAFLDKHALNLVTATLFGVALWRLGVSAELPAVLAFIFGGVLLAAIDWKVNRLPTKLVYLTLAGVTVGLVAAALIEWDWRPLATAAAGAFLFFNAFYLVHFFGKRLAGLTVIGMGDVRLALVMGALLGWYGLEYVLWGAVAGNLLALLFVGAMYVRDRKIHGRYAFGPSLIAGTLAVVLLHG